MPMTSFAVSAAPVGRERELTLLGNALAAARSGEGRLVLVGGEAGIGKTTLVTAFAREAAAQGALVFSGGCYDLTTTPPYGPWNEIARQWAACDTSPAEVPQPLDLLADLSMEPIGSKQELLALIASLCNASTDRTHLLLLEDIHWSDSASLELLQTVVRAIARRRVLLIVTYRDDEVTRQHPLFALLPVLARTPGAERLTLAPLQAASTRQMVAERYSLSLSDAERLVGFVQARTEGNPLFVSEVLRAIEETGALKLAGEEWLLGDLALTRTPQLVRDVIESRLVRLGSEARAALEVAAVIGRDVPVDVWVAASGQDDRVLARAAERAVEAHLVTELPRGAGLRFTHELVRETLYYGLGLLRRRRWHRRVGEVLEAMPRPDPDAIAHHFQQSGDERAFDWLLRAAQRAERAWAWVAATDRLEAALELAGEDALPPSERGWLLYRLAMLLRMTEPLRALSLLDETAQLARAADDALLTAHSRYNHGRLKLFVGSWAGSLEDMAAGLEALEALPPLADNGHTQLDIVDAHTARGTYIVWLALVGDSPTSGGRPRSIKPKRPVTRRLPLLMRCRRRAGDRRRFQGRPEAAFGRFRQASICTGKPRIWRHPAATSAGCWSCASCPTSPTMYSYAASSRRISRMSGANWRA